MQLSREPAPFYGKRFLFIRSIDRYRHPNFGPVCSKLYTEMYMFETLMLKVIVLQIRIAVIILKDACLYMAILPEHRRLPRFVFGSEVYQCRVLPFGLVLSLTLTKCLEDDLATLHDRASMFPIIQTTGSSWLTRGIETPSLPP